MFLTITKNLSIRSQKLFPSRLNAIYVDLRCQICGAKNDDKNKMVDEIDIEEVLFLKEEGNDYQMLKYLDRRTSCLSGFMQLSKDPYSEPKIVLCNLYHPGLLMVLMKGKIDWKIVLVGK